MDSQLDFYLRSDDLYLALVQAFATDAVNDHESLILLLMNHRQRERLESTRWETRVLTMNTMSKASAGTQSILRKTKDRWNN